MKLTRTILFFIGVLLAPIGHADDCGSALQTIPEGFHGFLHDWGSVESDAIRGPIGSNRLGRIQRQFSIHPVFKPALDYMAPDYLTDLSVPDPVTFTKLYRSYLDLLNVPEELRIIPGGAYKNEAGDIKFIAHGEPVPAGYVPIVGNMDSQLFVRSIHHGIMPLSWSLEMESKFDMAMFHHDLTHALSFLHLPYLRAIRTQASMLVELMDDPKIKLKFTRYVGNHHHIFDIFEEFAYIPDEKKPRLQEFLDGLEISGPKKLSIDEEVFVATHITTMHNIIFISDPDKLELETLQKSFRKVVERISETNRKLRFIRRGQDEGEGDQMTDRASVAELEKTLAQLEGRRRKISNNLYLASSGYRKFLAGIRLLGDEIVFELGGALADGISILMPKYSNFGFYLNYQRAMKALENNYLSMEYISRYGFNLNDIEVKLTMAINSLIQLSQHDLSNISEKQRESLLNAPRSWIQQEE